VAEALRIATLGTRGFRNLAPDELRPGARFNLIRGDNGQGKSNLLEAIDYLGSLHSFRGALAAELIARTAHEAQLAATVLGTSVPRRFVARLGRETPRALQIDGKRPRNRASYLAAIQTVLFHPGDLWLVSGAPELRRSWLDRILEHFDATYASTLASYERARRSRNRLLRAVAPDRRALVAYHELLAGAGAIIGQARERVIRELGALVVETFEAISGEELRLELRYLPRVEPELSQLRAALEASVDKDIARGFTAEGPHADDLGFVLDGVLAKRFGSQGQQRAIVLALKVAELHELTRRVGRVPILLLDDVSSELDKRRNRRLFDLLGALGGQVFLTTTQPELILIDHDRTDFKVEAGVVQRA
jgi:DNA replication and repair protein RecF